MTTVQLIPSPEIATHGPTVIKTERNDHEVRCGMCAAGRSVSTKKLLVLLATQSKPGLDDPIRCEVCKEEYDELFYEG